MLDLENPRNCHQPSFLPNPSEVDIKYSRQRALTLCLEWLLGSTSGRFLAFAGLGITQIIVGAELVHWFNGDDWHASFWLSWCLFIDPGTQTGLDAATHSFGNLSISAGLSIAGWIYSMTLLGLILSGVNDLLHGWREEHNRLWCTPDVALVCFNEKSLHYLKQSMCRMPKGWRRHQIVILADMDEVEMERNVLSHLGPVLRRHGVKVNCRRGSPYDLDHLQRSGVGRAKEIVLLSHSDDDASIIRRVTTMGALPEGISGNVYVDISSQEAAIALQTILPGTTIIRSHRMSMRLLCLLATDPALAACLLELDRQLVTVQATAAMDNLCFADLGKQEWFDASLCIGIQSAKRGNVVLSPPGQRKIRKGDQLLVVGGVGGSGAGERLVQTQLAVREKRARAMEENPTEHVALCGNVSLLKESGHGYSRHSKTIIILGWPVDADYMLEVIDNHASLGASVHVLSEKPVAEREAEVEGCPSLQNIKLIHHVGNRLLCRDLSALPISSADSILVLSRELRADETSSASDSECLLCAVMVMGFFAGRWGPRTRATQSEDDAPPSGAGRIICEMLSPDSERTFLQNAGLKSRCLLFRSHAYEASMIASRVASVEKFMAHRQLLQGGLYRGTAEGAPCLSNLRDEYRGSQKDRGPLLAAWQDDTNRAGISVASASRLDLSLGRNSKVFFLRGLEDAVGSAGSISSYSTSGSSQQPVFCRVGTVMDNRWDVEDSMFSPGSPTETGSAWQKWHHAGFDDSSDDRSSSGGSSGEFDESPAASRACRRWTRTGYSMSTSGP